MSTASNYFIKTLTRVFLILTIISLWACGGGDAPPEADKGEPLPVAINDTTFVSIHFSGSANCAECHNGLTDSSNTDVSIESDWSTSMMANSARDPFFRAKVASEIQRNPQLKSVLDDKCSRCHTPMANVEAKFEGAIVELFDDGFLNPQNMYYNHAMDGGAPPQTPSTWHMPPSKQRLSLSAQGPVR